MNSPHQIISMLTGNEFFRPKEGRNLSLLFDPLLEKLKGKKIAIVGGTNGKGETCLSLEWCLKKSNKTVSTFTSPHTFCLTERFRLNSENITPQKLREYLFYFEKVHHKDHELSYFELCFWVFLVFCIDEDPDYIICEVGLGGRLDMTNLLTPTVSAITNISRDHTDILGHTYKEILSEKLGICREGTPLVTSISSSYLKKYIHIYQSKMKFHVTYSPQGSDFSSTNKKLAALLFEKLTGQSIHSSMFNELIKNSVDHRTIVKKKEQSTLYIFGAHNLDGHRKLKIFLTNKVIFDEIILSFSNRSEVEIKNIISNYLSGGFSKSRIIINGLPFFKSANLDSLERVVKEFKKNLISVIKTEDDLKWIFLEKKNILWTGSYYSYGLLND